MPPLPSPAGRRYRVNVCRSTCTALSPESGTKFPLWPRPPPGDGPSAVRGWRRTGTARARPTRTRGGADSGPASRQRIPCRQLSACGTLASYRVGPTSAVGLGLPTGGQARRERRVQGESGPGASDRSRRPNADSPGRRAPRRHPRRTLPPGLVRARGSRPCAPRPEPEPITRGEASSQLRDPERRLGAH